MKLEEYLRNQYSNYIRPLYIKSYCESCGVNDNLELHHIKQFSEILKETLEELNISYYDDIKAYTDNQIELINYVMLGKQLKCNYLTLCSKCHDDEHINNLIRSFSSPGIKDRKYWHDLELTIQLDNKYIGTKITTDIKNDMVYLYLHYMPQNYRSWQQLKRLLEYNGHTVLNNKNGTFIDKIPSKKDDINIIEKERINNIIMPYLESIKDKKLNKDDQKELINIVNAKDNRNRLLKIYSSINQWLYDNKLNYNITSKQLRENGSRIRYWIVNKLN